MNDPTLNDRETARTTGDEPPDPSVPPMYMIMPPASPRKAPTLAQVAWTWVGVLALLITIMAVTGWLIMTALNNWHVTNNGEEITFLQGVSAALIVYLSGLLFRLSSRRS